MTNTINFCDMACEILQKSNDGDSLDPRDLKITEMAVNGHLNEAGEAYFQELHKRVIVGEYFKPYLHDVEFFTINTEGFIYYKDIQVEHYNSPFAYSEEGKQALIELSRRCKIFEEKGLKIGSTNLIWNWEEISGEYKEPEYLRNIIQKITKEFNINGCCDLVYMCNVVAKECGIGDGNGKYLSYEEVKNIEIEGNKIIKAAERLCSCYRLPFTFAYETLKELNNI